MKKLKYILVIMILLTINSNVYAETSKNGINVNRTSDNYTNIVCTYSAGTYVNIRETDHLEIEPSSLFSQTSYDELKKSDFLDENDNWDCPLYAIYKSNSNEIDKFTNTPPTGNMTWQKLETNQSECEGKCSKYTGFNSKYKCTYKSGKKTLNIEGDGTTCTVTHSNGSKETMTNGVCSQISAECPDLFYNSRTKEFLWATYDFNKWFENENHYNSEAYDFICGNDNDNVEYYCSGSCEFSNNKKINCSKINKKISGATGKKAFPSICKQSGVLKFFRFIGYVFLVVKIIVPIILIVWGSMDFGKAIINNPDEVKKAATKFAYRIIAGIVVFLIPTIVNFKFNLLPSSTSSYKACNTCLTKPNKCKIPE